MDAMSSSIAAPAGPIEALQVLPASRHYSSFIPESAMLLGRPVQLLGPAERATTSPGRRPALH